MRRLRAGLGGPKEAQWTKSDVDHIDLTLPHMGVGRAPESHVAWAPGKRRLSCQVPLSLA